MLVPKCVFLHSGITKVRMNNTCLHPGSYLNILSAQTIAQITSNIFIASFTHICEASNRFFLYQSCVAPGLERGNVSGGFYNFSNTEVGRLRHCNTHSVAWPVDVGCQLDVCIGRLLYIYIIIYIYTYLEPVCPLFWELNPPKEGRNSNQNKGPHLGSRYIN